MAVTFVTRQWSIWTFGGNHCYPPTVYMDFWRVVRFRSLCGILCAWLARNSHCSSARIKICARRGGMSQPVPPPPPPPGPVPEAYGGRRAPAGTEPPEPPWAAGSDDRSFNQAAPPRARPRSERRRSRAPGGLPPDPARASPPVNVRRSSRNPGGSRHASKVAVSSRYPFGVIAPSSSKNTHPWGPKESDSKDPRVAPINL